MSTRPVGDVGVEQPAHEDAAVVADGPAHDLGRGLGPGQLDEAGLAGERVVEDRAATRDAAGSRSRVANASRRSSARRTSTSGSRSS